MLALKSNYRPGPANVRLQARAACAASLFKPLFGGIHTGNRLWSMAACGQERSLAQGL